MASNNTGAPVTTTPDKVTVSWTEQDTETGQFEGPWFPVPQARNLETATPPNKKKLNRLRNQQFLLDL